MLCLIHNKVQYLRLVHARTYTGKVVNIRDAYKHPNFFQDVDKNTGFHTRNILCFPIMLQREIVGVAQLCNKIDGELRFPC